MSSEDQPSKGPTQSANTNLEWKCSNCKVPNTVGIQVESYDPQGSEKFTFSDYLITGIMIGMTGWILVKIFTKPDSGPSV